MLRCCAGICGGARASARSAPAADEPKRRPVVKPVTRLDEAEDSKPPSFESLIERFGMQVAPPGVDAPIPAIASGSFQRTVGRLLVVIPSSGAPAGAWNGNDSAAELLSWAEANGYATAVFSAQALEASPSELWDRVLKGSPAGCVTVLVASGMMPVLKAALQPMHPLLFTRFRAVCVAANGRADMDLAPRKFAQRLMEEGPAVSAELQGHLRAILVRIPDPAGLDSREWHQHFFELLQEREERFQKMEGTKYSGFQGLKENDMPGLRRISLDKRIQRLDRDRGNDELAQLLKSHERQAGVVNEEDEEEPGVD